MTFEQELALLGGLIVVATIWLTLHGVMAMRVFVYPNIPSRWRWAALLPPVLPVLAWRLRFRVSVVLWALLGLSYGVLYLLGL